MKQYTTPDQTAKLIELGFEKPKSIEAYKDGHCVPFVEQQWTYSIGELIEMLPRCIESRGGDEAVLEISYDSQDFEWYCGHRWAYNRSWRFFNKDYRTCDDKELIDALYRYIVALKK